MHLITWITVLKDVTVKPITIFVDNYFRVENLCLHTIVFFHDYCVISCRVHLIHLKCMLDAFISAWLQHMYDSMQLQAKHELSDSNIKLSVAEAKLDSYVFTSS